jgi:hypothetical protein
VRKAPSENTSIKGSNSGQKESLFQKASKILTKTFGIPAHNIDTTTLYAEEEVELNLNTYESEDGIYLMFPFLQMLHLM